MVPDRPLRKGSGNELDIPCFWRSDIGAVPPTAAQGLEERSGIGIAAGLCLHESDQRRIIGVLGSKQPEIGDGAELQLAPYNFEALEGGALRRKGRLQRVRVGL